MIYLKMCIFGAITDWTNAWGAFCLLAKQASFRMFVTNSLQRCLSSLSSRLYPPSNPSFNSTALDLETDWMDK